MEDEEYPQSAPNGAPSEGMPITVNLHDYDPALKRLRIEGRWDFVPETRAGVEAIDGDLLCFLLDKDKLTREDEDFVFYNNPQGAQLAVRLFDDTTMDMGEENDEILTIDFEQLPYDIWYVVLGFSVYQGVQRDQSLDTLRHGMLIFSNHDTGQELCRIPFKAHRAGQTAIKVAELVRNGGSWTVTEQREGTSEGAGALATQYGLLISSTS